METPLRKLVELGSRMKLLQMCYDETFDMPQYPPHEVKRKCFNLYKISKRMERIEEQKRMRRRQQNI